jgi:hypothetical protein
MKARERMIDQETIKDEQDYKAMYAARRQLPILQTLDDMSSSLYQQDDLPVDAKKVTLDVKISQETKSEKVKTIATCDLRIRLFQYLFVLE